MLEAPSSAQLVEAFVNTVDVELGTDDLAVPDQLPAWLAERGLLPSGTPVTTEEHQLALRLRDGIRENLGVHTGDTPDPGLLRDADEVLRRLPLVATLRPGSRATLEPAPGLTPSATPWPPSPSPGPSSRSPARPHASNAAPNTPARGSSGTPPRTAAAAGAPCASAATAPRPAATRRSGLRHLERLAEPRGTCAGPSPNSPPVRKRPPFRRVRLGRGECRDGGLGGRRPGAVRSHGSPPGSAHPVQRRRTPLPRRADRGRGGSLRSDHGSRRA